MQWGASLPVGVTACKNLCDKVASASTEQVTALHKVIFTLYSLLETAVLDVQEFLKEERRALRVMKLEDLAEISTHENVSHLKQHNKILAQSHARCLSTKEKMKKRLNRIKLLGEFMRGTSLLVENQSKVYKIVS
jgi:hypothetical protein